MTKVKVEHFVPRVYLRGWAGKRDTLYVFDKPSGRISESGVKNVAAEGGFYDLPAQPGQPTEEWLSKFEGDLASTLKSVVKDWDAGLALGNVQKQRLVEFMSLQHLRTAETRRDIEQTQSTFVRALEGEHLAPNLQEMVKHARDPQQSKAIHVAMINDPVNALAISTALLEHIWILGVNDTGHPLWTSDDPVVRQANIHDPYQSYFGLGSTGIEVYFPLNPRYVLILAERSFHHGVATLDGDRLSLLPANITYLNSLQVTLAYRQVFSPDAQFALATKMRVDHPDNFKLDRVRVTLGG